MKRLMVSLASLAVLILLCFNSNPAFAQAACTPKCDDKECGDNGCSGICGTCEAGKECDANQKCVAKAAPAPTTTTTECEDDSECTKDGEVCKPASKRGAKGTCVPDPCLSMPFSDGDDYGCRVAAAVDLRMPRTIAGVRAVLLRDSPKAFEAYKKSVETLTRYYMWEVFDYFMDGPDDFKKAGSPNYWDNAKIREHLMATPTNLEVLANARWNLPHKPKPAPKKAPATEPVPNRG